MSVFIRCPQCRRDLEIQPIDWNKYDDENEKRKKEGRNDLIKTPEFVIPVWCVSCANYWGLESKQGHPIKD